MERKYYGNEWMKSHKVYVNAESFNPARVNLLKFDTT